MLPQGQEETVVSINDVSSLPCQPSLSAAHLSHFRTEQLAWFALLGGKVYAAVDVWQSFSCPMPSATNMEKVYSTDNTKYSQKSVSKRIEALFLNNLGKVVTREQIVNVAIDPATGKTRENWHQRLSELRTDKGYTILSWRDSKVLSPEEYVMPHANRREIAGKRVLPTKECWTAVLARSGNQCEWSEDGQKCGLSSGAIDPVGGGTVKLTPDHVTPHSINPNTDPGDPKQWMALCARHQVMKKNYWDSGSGKLNVVGILQSVGEGQKQEALKFLAGYFGVEVELD